MSTKPRVLFLHRQNSAVAYYRQIIPARILAKRGYPVTYWENDTYHQCLVPKKKIRGRRWEESWFRENLGKFDLIWMDREIGNEFLKMISGFKHFSPGCRMIVDFDDDFLNVPNWNPSQHVYKPGQEPYETGLYHLRLAEMTTVSTQTLVERFEKRCHNIRLRENLIDPRDWAGLPINPERAKDRHIRVLYGGAAGHYGDLNEIRYGLEGMLRKQPVPWRLICFGTVPDWMHDMKQELPGKVVVLPWVPFRDYPRAVQWGDFDIALAPLKEHPFSATKSTIKWQEAAIQQIPLICSAVGPYKEIPDGCAIRVEESHVQWAEALLSLLTDAKLRDFYRENAFDAVQDHTIDRGAERVELIVEEAMSLPRIETLEDTRLPSDPVVAAPPAGVTSGP